MTSYEYESRGRGFLGRSEPRWVLRARDLEEREYTAHLLALHGEVGFNLLDSMLNRAKLLRCVTSELTRPAEAVMACILGLFVPVFPLLWGADNGVFTWKQALLIMLVVTCVLTVVAPIARLTAQRKAKQATARFVATLNQGEVLEEIARRAVQQSRESLIQEVGRRGARASLPYKWQQQ